MTWIVHAPVCIVLLAFLVPTVPMPRQQLVFAKRVRKGRALWLLEAGDSLTFCIDPVCVAIGQCCAVAELLDRFRRLVVHLED